MTDELKPSQRAREAAHRALASRGWFPSAGDVPYDVARDLLAERLERSILSDSRVEKVEAALREIRDTALCCSGKTAGEIEVFYRDIALAALNGGSDAAGPDKDDWGCAYCRNDGPLVDTGGTPRCPKCDAEYPDGGSDAE